LVRSGLAPTIYHIRGEHANHYTTDAVVLTIYRHEIVITNIKTVQIKGKYSNNHTKNNYKWQVMLPIKVRVMVVNATFNNISAIYRGGKFYWWRKPEYQEKTAASHWQTLSHNIVSSAPQLSVIRSHNVSGDRHWLHR
jgi:hypothetical protein